MTTEHGKRILLTGHRGYIGSVLAPYLVAQGHEVVGLDTGNLFVFRPGGSVTSQPGRVSAPVLRGLFDSLLMFWTGHQRSARTVLEQQRERTSSKLDALTQMRDHAHEVHTLFTSANGRAIDAGALGRTLDASWRLKRELASTITSPQIDAWYERALQAGAYGGKLCGAGGGGCLLFVVPPDRQEQVRAALDDLTEVRIGYEAHGSRVLLPLEY